MDINLTLIKGRLVIPPIIEIDPDGTCRARFLVLVRSDRRSRVDVVPVVVPNPPSAMLSEHAGSGAEVYVAGRLMRRCWVEPASYSTRLEVVADSVLLADGADDRTVL